MIIFYILIYIEYLKRFILLKKKIFFADLINIVTLLVYKFLKNDFKGIFISYFNLQFALLRYIISYKKSLQNSIYCYEDTALSSNVYEYLHCARFMTVPEEGVFSLF